MGLTAGAVGAVGAARAASLAMTATSVQVIGAADQTLFKSATAYHMLPL